MERNLPYHYVITSPPDYQELKMEPIKDHDEYYQFLRSVLSGLSPLNKTVSIIVSNRKYKRKTIAKNDMIKQIMIDLNYDLLTEKIWIKSEKVNLFRYNFSYVLNFGMKGFISRGYKPFLSDVWSHPINDHGRQNNFNIDVVKKCISNYTDEGHIVYDPFIGSGTTEVACMDLKRGFVGSEIDSKVCNGIQISGVSIQ